MISHIVSMIRRLTSRRPKLSASQAVPMPSDKLSAAQAREVDETKAMSRDFIG